MTDYEESVYDEVATALRARFSEIFIIGVELTDTPPKFPAVSIVQTNSSVNEKYSTFDKIDNVSAEEYKFDIYSNVGNQNNAKRQVKAIASVIDTVMCSLSYLRAFSQPIPGADAKITRRVARYKKTNVI
jgi:ribosomal protein L20A (L18A)